MQNFNDTPNRGGSVNFHQPKRKVWSADLKTYALSLRGQGETAAKIGSIIGKSRKAIESYFVRLDRAEGIPAKPRLKNVRTYWNEERVATLKALLAAGMSRSQAAAEMGSTKNAVTSIIDRLRQQGEVIKCRPPSIQVTQRRRPSGIRTAPRPPQVINHPPMTPVSLFERTGCCFPVNDGGPFLFCNNGVHFPTSYCEFHGNLMVSQE